MSNRVVEVMRILALAIVVLGAGCKVDLSTSRTVGVEGEKGGLVLKAGQGVVLRYRCEGVPFKPYVQELYSPAGVNVLRDAPADHLHHHGLMFAVAVDGANFWEEQQQPGRQQHIAFASYVEVGDYDGADKAGFDEQLNWIEPVGGKVLLKELRAIRVVRSKTSGATILTWKTSLDPAGDKDVTLSGSPYFGLGMRFVQSMDIGGSFFNADGGAGVQGTNDKPSRWCAYSAKADGRDVTVAMFDDPKNVRQPATWFTMEKPFAYLSATLALHKEPLEVVAGKSLILRYGVAVCDGRLGSEDIEELYRKWCRRRE